MIEESAIVQETRKIRSLISGQFNDNIDKYIDYLQSQKSLSKEKFNKEKSIQK